MRERISRARLFLSPALCVFALVLLFQVIFVQLVLGSNDTADDVSSDTTIPLAALPKSEPALRVPVGLPVRVMIPSIHLDAKIEQVKLTKDGSMDVPKKPMNTGWYALGPRPGETGSATLDGHVNWWRGASAVFGKLRNVKTGDTIAVEDENGVTVSFVVREIRTFDAGADALDVFSSHDGKSHLNIITCDGVWDTHARQYSKRLVVFTDRVTEPMVQTAAMPSP